MKITLELPDTTKAAFISYVDGYGDQLVLVTKAIGTKDLHEGYKDCREYDVQEG